MIERWLELHDSTIDAVDSHTGMVELRLSGYVHQWETAPEGRRGTGWLVPIAVRVAGHSTVPPVDTPVDVSDGSLSVGTVRLDNVIPLPFHSAGGARLTLELVTGGSMDLVGSSIEVVEAPGESRFVEDLREDLVSGTGSV